MLAYMPYFTEAYWEHIIKLFVNATYLFYTGYNTELNTTTIIIFEMTDLQYGFHLEV